MLSSASVGMSRQRLVLIHATLSSTSSLLLSLNREVYEGKIRLKDSLQFFSSGNMVGEDHIQNNKRRTVSSLIFGQL